jgi:acyl carrier protein|tara:strand:- start:2275 stop:2514 length:240 start_codon:yes stop_codon:yes gene_type:complete
MSNLNKYNKSFTETFSIKIDKLKKLKYNSISKWDSIGHMSLIGKLEDTFNISMEMDDIIDFSSYEFGKKILKKYKIVIK